MSDFEDHLVANYVSIHQAYELRPRCRQAWSMTIDPYLVSPHKPPCTGTPATEQRPAQGPKQLESGRFRV